MFKPAFKNFIRSRIVIASLTIFFSAGLLSIFLGKQFLEKQQANIEAVTLLQKEQIERNVKVVNDQFGLLLYYLRFAYIKQPDRLAALAIGQQDVNASIQYLTIRGLEGQRYDTDLFNPYNQLAGNFDLSFVVLFLFPLLIIAFTYNLLSQEKEQGTWQLLNVHTLRPLRLMFCKLFVRYLVVIVLLAVLLLSAVLIVQIPADAKFFAFCLTIFCYVTVWFSISFFVVGLHKNSNTTALLLMSIWALLCILFPAIINSYITWRYPVKEAYSTFLKQRDGYHKKWDADPRSTMNAFFRHYPAYRHYTWNSPKFNYMWYYAMQQLGDDEAALDSRAMFDKLQQRGRASADFSMVFPPMLAQLNFTNVAGTGLSDHLFFLDHTATFHERKKLHFYPRIFGDSIIANEDWSRHTPEFAPAKIKLKGEVTILPSILYIVVLTVGGILFFNRKMKPS